MDYKRLTEKGYRVQAVKVGLDSTKTAFAALDPRGDRIVRGGQANFASHDEALEACDLHSKQPGRHYAPFIGGKEMPTDAKSPSGCKSLWLYESTHVPGAVYIEAQGTHIMPELLVAELQGYIAHLDHKKET